MFKRIFVAIDRSDAAANAARTAERLASQVDAELTLIHVIDPISHVAAEGIGRFEPTLEELQQIGAKLLADTRAQISPDLAVTTQLLEGDVPQVIVSAAVAEDVDLIVMGTNSRGRLAHFLLGSTADTVIRHAPCPVMAVRAEREIRKATKRESRTQETLA